MAFTVAGGKIAAIEILAQVSADDPANFEALRALGICYLEIREPKTALDALERSLRAEPDDADTHYVMGSACGTLGNLERAAACYRRALELNPAHAKADYAACAAPCGKSAPILC